MARKRRCIDCEESTFWALPRKVTEDNIDYAKHCLNIAKKTIVCGRTMKTKGVNHEQYCKHFVKKGYECTWYQKEIEELEKMINDYETKAGA